MKNYQKPTINLESITAFETLSNLSSWLEGQGSEYENAGITTFEIVS